MNNVLIFILLGIVIITIIFGLYYQIKDYYSEQDPILISLKKDLISLDPGASKLNIYKSTDGTYIINKRKIYLCTHDKKTGKMYDRNILCPILIHELAHHKCDEVGHTEKFFNILDKLTKRAENMGLYDPSVPIPEDYCKA